MASLEDIQGSMHAKRDAASKWPGGGRASAPWRLSGYVIGSIGPAGAEFARHADTYGSPSCWPSWHTGSYWPEMDDTHVGVISGRVPRLRVADVLP